MKYVILIRLIFLQTNSEQEQFTDNSSGSVVVTQNKKKNFVWKNVLGTLFPYENVSSALFQHGSTLLIKLFSLKSTPFIRPISPKATPLNRPYFRCTEIIKYNVLLRCTLKRGHPSYKATISFQKGQRYKKGAILSIKPSIFYIFFYDCVWFEIWIEIGKKDTCTMCLE